METALVELTLMCRDVLRHEIMFCGKGLQRASMRKLDMMSLQDLEWWADYLTARTFNVS